ncbi:Ribonuclease P/MRP protein subunit RPP1 [Candida viswanathii]|uniref:Ribonuclease P/MRP protein subunit RPP1 n=1 Tax=Candida viswanathii TaxID=5486 RepID=A0A367Y473_9ASCO|nr:Ribonuclease P/MRP protein subunit RPP1 [Candida viswanathii]
MSYDLNIPWPVNSYDKKPNAQELQNLKNTIVTNYSLGVTHQAINFTLPDTVKVPLNTPSEINPIPITSLLQDLRPKFPKLRLFSRVTLVVNDLTKVPSLGKLANHFDVIAIQPNNEKALQLTVLNLDVDLISVNLVSRLNYFLKFKALHTAIEKGIKFEINYAQLTAGSAGYSSSDTSGNLIKKNFFHNVLQLIRGTRSNGLVISSGAQNPLQLRNVNDVLILLGTLGLERNKGKKFITEYPEKVLISGKLKTKSYRQTIAVNDSEKFAEDKEGTETDKLSGVGYKKKLEDSSSGRLLKKRKLN